MIATVQAEPLHCKLCFDTLIAKLTKLPPPEWPKELPDISAPLFVTWTITKNHNLRGCIGTFQPSQLSSLLPKYSLISSLKDSRFKPVSIDEVEGLSVTVSLLVNFQEGKKAMDWQIGKNGIIINFEYNGQDYQATYLPQVAEQQKWSKEQAIESLVDKAGYEGNYKNVIQKIKLTTYESSKKTLSYAEYKKMINA